MSVAATRVASPGWTRWLMRVSLMLCPSAQYPGLESAVAADLATMLALADLGHRLFPATEWRWLFEELQRQARVADRRLAALRLRCLVVATRQYRSAVPLRQQSPAAIECRGLPRHRLASCRAHPPQAAPV
jgi:hypothetical protein